MRHPVKLERLDRIERIVVELVAQTVPKVQVVFGVLFKEGRESTAVHTLTV